MAAINNAIAGALSPIAPLFAPISSISQSLGLNDPMIRGAAWFGITGGAYYYFKPLHAFTEGGASREWAVSQQLMGDTVTADSAYFPWYVVAGFVGFGAMNYA